MNKENSCNSMLSRFILIVCCILSACHSNEKRDILSLYQQSDSLSLSKNSFVEDDSLAVADWVVCDGENLIVYDVHLGYAFTLFDQVSGNYISRLGRIGQGTFEMPVGGYGYLCNKCLYWFNDQIKIVMKYHVDSLRHGLPEGKPVCLTRYNIPEAMFSQLIPLNDSTFLGAGTYQSKYQYLLFDNQNRILDYDVKVYNAEDEAFYSYTVYLSNQGSLVKHPTQAKFAYALNFSSNIDFIEIVNDKIKQVKSLRLGNPVYRPNIDATGKFHTVDFAEETITGYVNLCATEKFVYALYSNKKVFANQRRGQYIMIFDWEGNPVKKYDLDTNVYSIAVDEGKHRIFLLVKNEEGSWAIVSNAI